MLYNFSPQNKVISRPYKGKIQLPHLPSLFGNLHTVVHTLLPRITHVDMEEQQKYSQIPTCYNEAKE